MNAPLPLRRETVPRWRAVRKVLAVRLDNMGDVLMTTPAFAAIRNSLPDARLSLLASPGGACVARHVADIDEVIEFQAPWSKSPAVDNELGAAVSSRECLQMIRQLANQSFDAAIIFTVCTQSALPAAMLCLLAGIPLRLAHCRENPYGLLTDWLPDTEVIDDQMRHEVSRQLALVAEVGMHPPSELLQFRYSAGDAERMRIHLADAGLRSGKPYFVVHVGASAASRRYPAASFGIAARMMVERSGHAAVFTGDASEQDLVEEARAAMGIASVSVAGRLRLGELGALIAGARTVVTNNSGPAHLAAALGTPVVDLYALTNPQHTPWMVPARVLYRNVPCRNCLKSVCPEVHHACLRGVSPQRVAQAGLELMGVEHDLRASETPFDRLPGFPAPHILTVLEGG